MPYVHLYIATTWSDATKQSVRRATPSPSPSPSEDSMATDNDIDNGSGTMYGESSTCFVPWK